MLEQLDELESSALQELEAADTQEAVEAWRISYLGTKGRLRAVMPMLNLSAEGGYQIGTVEPGNGQTSGANGQ